jgi:translation elongation factor EF-1beta
MITIDYYNPDGSIYHTQQFTENLHAETKTITVQGGERVEILHLTIYTQTLPSRITLPTVRVGKSIDLTIQNREIKKHISKETWYAPNAKVQWYIMQGTDWITLTDEPVAEGVKEVVLKYVVETDCGIVESDNIVIVVTTDLEHIQSTTQNIYKIIRDNKIFIIRDDKMYSIMGQEVRK